MKILNIIEKNQPGLLATITTLLEGAGVDVRDIDGHTEGEYAVISLRATPYGRCHRTLADAGYKVFTADHLLIKVDDHPGALAELSRRLANEQVDIRSIHIVEKSGDSCIVAVDTTNAFRAGQVLHEFLVREPD